MPRTTTVPGRSTISESPCGARDRRSDLRSGVGSHRCADSSTIRRHAMESSTTVAIVGVVEPDWPERAAAEHLLPSGAAEVAWLAVGKRSPRGGGRAVSRSAGVRVAANLRLDVHARRRRARLALDPARRDAARPLVDGGARAVRARADLPRRGVVARAGGAGAARRRIARVGGAATQPVGVQRAGVPRHESARPPPPPGR